MTAEERRVAGTQIAERMAEVLERVDGVIALYAAKGSEVETRAIDAAARVRGLRVVYPRVVDGERVLAFHEVAIGELVVGTFGLDEPPPGAPVVALGEISAFVVPGVAFDRTGARLGWGRGYYDATLALAPAALRIGLAFECQVVDAVDHETHDVRMNLIVTEVATHVA